MRDGESKYLRVGVKNTPDQFTRGGLKCDVEKLPSHVLYITSCLYLTECVCLTGLHLFTSVYYDPSVTVNSDG